MDITGVIIKKLQKQSGTSANGQWQKQEFVIQTEDQYPKTVCFNTWGAKVDDLNNFSEGNRVKVHFDVSSREYNERWYSEMRAWKIDLEDAGGPTGSVPPAHNQGGQASAPTATPTQSTAASSSETAEDDLPF
ncbi:MAG TPA: DUF3127 domain-containing protein [Chitinophagales bacterium]|nr:DUF3127 domain-containing protein [Chitinophagales bacterium]